ncbi:hypothetical protein LTR56_021885 [Elasticomyces elasticus]|nr:hypothetical protein LTR56_021885 [Elasticomyces elasticus]KAK3630308.1 hypothetical protein LTR22_021570 [Elasticomyces elasticus]KAK4908972.1 hypothetical protein LTR49_022196 [Elasticomyces elasticus]KAK5754742.1 hypothetical protein LTS12_015153 [Elasticomyces elasticus]
MQALQTLQESMPPGTPLAIDRLADGVLPKRIAEADMACQASELRRRKAVDAANIEALTLQGAGSQDLRWDDDEFAALLDGTVMTMTGCLLGEAPLTSFVQGCLDSQLYLSGGCLEQQDAHGVKHERRHEHSASDPASNVHASPSLLGDVQVDRKDDVRLETSLSTTASGTSPVPRNSLLSSDAHAGDDFHVRTRQAIPSTLAIKAKRTQQNREAAHSASEERQGCES